MRKTVSRHPKTENFQLVLPNFQKQSCQFSLSAEVAFHFFFENWEGTMASQFELCKAIAGWIRCLSWMQLVIKLLVVLRPQVMAKTALSLSKNGRCRFFTFRLNTSFFCNDVNMTARIRTLRAHFTFFHLRIARISSFLYIMLSQHYQHHDFVSLFADASMVHHFASSLLMNAKTKAMHACLKFENNLR